MVYIKNKIANSFIKPLKSLTRAFIFSYKKLNMSLQYMDYQDFKNWIIKNRYFLLLIRELLDQLG